MYSFSKVRNSNGFYEFRNPYFQRGNIQELGKIKRKCVGPEKGKSDSQSMRENSSDEFESKIVNYKLVSLMREIEKLSEDNQCLSTKLENIKKEKEEQFKSMSSIIVALVKNYNPVFMNKLKANLLEDHCPENSNITLTQAQNFMHLFSTMSQKLNHDSERAIEVFDQMYSVENISDIMERHLSKPKPPIPKFKGVDQNNLYDDKSKISQSESYMESKVAESHMFKHAFAGPEHRNDTERYSMLDAYEILTMQKDRSKVSEMVEPIIEEEEEKLEMDFESRKCSLDYFELEKNI